MGAEFIERTKRSFQKHWNTQRVALCTSDLFTREPKGATRRAMADIAQGCQLSPGASVIVEREGEQIVARQGNKLVATLRNPTNILRNAIQASGGVANGSIEKILPSAGMAEISLC